MLHNLSIGELAEQLAAKKISSVELTRHFWPASSASIRR
jgi:hypothetical protein